MNVFVYGTNIKKNEREIAIDLHDHHHHDLSFKSCLCGFLEVIFPTSSSYNDDDYHRHYFNRLVYFFLISGSIWLQQLIVVVAYGFYPYKIDIPINQTINHQMRDNPIYSNFEKFKMKIGRKWNDNHCVLYNNSFKTIHRHSVQLALLCSCFYCCCCCCRCHLYRQWWWRWWTKIFYVNDKYRYHCIIC